MRRIIAAMLAVLAPGVAWGQGTPTFQTLSTTGNAAVGGTLQVGGAGTITGFGTAIGQAPVWTSNSGFPGFAQTQRILLQLQSSAPTDFAVLQVQRTTGFTGGSSAANVSSAVTVATTVGAHDATSEWALVAKCNTFGAAGGNCVPIFAQGLRQPGATDFVWGGIMDAIDQTHLNTALTSAMSGAEIDLRADWADDAANGAKFGGAGVRQLVQLAAHRNTIADTTPFEMSSGIWFTSGTTGAPGSDDHTYFDSLISPAVGVQMRAGLDTRGGVVPTGSTDPLAAVVMAAGQTIDFNGSASLTSNPGGRYLTYGGTKLQYMNAGTEELSVSDVGVTIVGGGSANALTITPASVSTNPIVFDQSGTGGFSFGANNFIRVGQYAPPSGGNMVLGTGSALATNATTGMVRFPTTAGAPTGAAPVGSIVVDTTNSHICALITGTTWHCI